MKKLKKTRTSILAKTKNTKDRISNFALKSSSTKKSVQKMTPLRNEHERYWIFEQEH